MLCGKQKLKKNLNEQWCIIAQIFRRAKHSWVNEETKMLRIEIYRRGRKLPNEWTTQLQIKLPKLSLQNSLLVLKVI